MTEQCRAYLMLIPAGEDEPERHDCEKRAGHQDFHGTLDGVGWHASDHADLREALMVQFEANHAEHCTNTWPCPKGERCHWPLPTALGGDPAAWRSYDDPSRKPSSESSS